MSAALCQEHMDSPDSGFYHCFHWVNHDEFGRVEVCCWCGDHADPEPDPKGTTHGEYAPRVDK